MRRKETGIGMAVQPIAITIRSKKLGVLIRAARLVAGKSVLECAQAMNVSNETFEAFEMGDAPPSLPELEVLAYFLDVPLEHFWGQEVNMPARPRANRFNVGQLIQLRNKIVGTLVRQARTEAEISFEALASQAGITEERLALYEIGEQPIPLPELEAIAKVVNRPIRDFQDARGPIARLAAQQLAIQQFSELSPELRDFITRPVNRPYLELAQRLSEMSVDKLRAVAEGLLEITL
jgi:transcriptional regulator with XRE-family HTH domain